MSGRIESNDAGWPVLSIVVETINTARGKYGLLEEVLRALGEQTLPREAFEVLVVADPADHPSLDGLLSRVAPRARLVHAPAMHYYAQKNLGARSARGRIVGFIDSDCIPKPSWGASVVEAFSRHGEELGAIAGTQWTDKSPMGVALVVSVFGHLQARAERRTVSLAASNCAFRRDDLLAHPFEEDPVFHGPDVRLVARLYRNGRFVLLVPEVATRHRHVPEMLPFFARGVYWGYCFVELRRDGSSPVRYGRLVRAFWPLAPLALVPAKLAVDLRRLLQRRKDIDLRPWQLAAPSGLLLLNSLAVGYGAALSVARRPIPKTPF